MGKGQQHRQRGVACASGSLHWGCCVSRWGTMTYCFLLSLAGPGASASAPSYLSSVTSESDFDAISIPYTGRPDILRVSKFMTPALNDPSLLPTVYQNVNLQPLHLEFLLDVFPERFAGLTMPEYMAMIERRETRQYFVGGVFLLEDGEGNIRYGFDVYTDPSDPAELLTAQETAVLYSQLAATFALRPFAYAPTSFMAIEEALSWIDPGFPMYFPGDVIAPAYAGYTLAENYGRVRLMTLAELAQANLQGSLSWQDIVVLDAVPTDIEGVVAGVITGEPQGELSHLAIRMARRGTPNAFVENARQVFSSYEGQLVRLVIGQETYTVVAGVDPAEARAWWEEHRPLLPNVLVPDLAYASLDGLPAMAVAEASAPLAARFGGKAANLARMYRFLPAQHQVPGFAIPFRYYHEFMTSNHIPDDRVQPPALRMYEDYLYSLFNDPQFQSDGAYRAARLATFRDYARAYGQVNPALVNALVERIRQVFGSTSVMVRFRSSSNVEDSILFNGAGLYDSTSVCAQDSLDSDYFGPSHCDANQENERTIERGLKKVWASLWNFRAYEERSYFQVPQERAAMAILVTPAFPDEAANGVALTGDPIVGATAGYVINVQVGDYSVVQPGAGVLAEKDILEMASGEVVAIHRAHPSSLMPPGEWVLSDEQLRRLGAALAIVDASLPLALEGYSRDDVLLDVEFKFTQGGELIFKQVRPFLRSVVAAPRPGDFFRLIIPRPMTLCQMEYVGFTIQDAYALLSQVDLIPGTIYLPKNVDEFEIDLIRELRFGPAQTSAVPQARGRFTLQMEGTYKYYFRQPFSVENESILLSLELGGFRNGDPPRIIEEENLGYSFYLAATIDDTTQIAFSSGRFGWLPLYRAEVELEGGRRVLLDLKYQFGMIHGAQRFYLIAAEAFLPEGDVRQDDYWHLISASPDNPYWPGIPEVIRILFDDPLGDVHGIGIATTNSFWPWSEQFEIRVASLDENLETLHPLRVLSFNLRLADLKINEYMALNVSTSADEQGDFDPWVEIHNLRGSDAYLGNCYLSDDPNNPARWPFPSSQYIPARGFVVIWADNEPAEGELHTSFCLDPAGGHIGLYESNGTLIDSVSYGPQSADVSEGRLPDGTGEVVSLDHPSPGFSNGAPPTSQPAGSLWILR